MDVPSASQPGVRTAEIGPPSARAETWNVLRAAALIVLAAWIYIADTTAPAGVGGGGAAAAGAGVAAPGTAPSGAAGGGAAEARDLMPYQRLFRTLGGEDQRLFRELQEGLIEAENARSAARSWPAPAALAAQGIPPFADVPARGGRRRYRWELRQEGLIVNYLGVPADRRDPAFLLLVQEPDPQVPAAGGASPAGGGMPASGTAAGSGTSPAAQATDEIHHRLADGTLLHVSTWMREPPAGGPGGAASGAGTALGARGGIAAGGDRQVIAEPYARGWIQLLVGAVGR
jgi:hypothetical protein